MCTSAGKICQNLDLIGLGQLGLWLNFGSTNGGKVKLVILKKFKKYLKFLLDPF